MRVVCTGVGIVSPLGIGVSKAWQNLLGKHTAISRLKPAHNFEGCQSQIAAYVPEDDLVNSFASDKHIYLAKNSKQLSLATRYAMIATQEALEDAKLLDQDNVILHEFQTRTGVAIGQGMVDFEDIYSNFVLLDQQKNYRKVSPYFMTRALMNMSAGNVSIRHKSLGPNHCASTACATGAHSIGDAYNFIKLGKADIMICGSTEASINKLAIAGFQRLRALCTSSNDFPELGSRPFDEGRSGFVMGEGAGILILESLEHARGRGITDSQIYGEILGYGTSADAHHLTAPLPDGNGARRCMSAALADAKLKPSDITQINAHATSTPIGDDIECAAIESLFYSDSGIPRDDLLVTSCKSSIGHLLGAAGSVETIFALLSCKNSVIPHCKNLVTPLITSRGFIKFARQEPQPWSVSRRVLLKNSFGFGGTNASLVIASTA